MPGPSESGWSDAGRSVRSTPTGWPSWSSRRGDPSGDGRRPFDAVHVEAAHRNCAFEAPERRPLGGVADPEVEAVLVHRPDGYPRQPR